MTAGSAVVVQVLEAVGTMPHTAAVVAVDVGVGCAAVTHLALVSGRQDKCKIQCSCLCPSSKPHPTGIWISACSKGNTRHDLEGGMRVKMKTKRKKRSEGEKMMKELKVSELNAWMN